MNYYESDYSKWQSDYTDEIYHYGIKGMRWGVRRFQNSDGSYTSAGKKRYSTGKTNAGVSAKKAVVTAATVTALHGKPKFPKEKSETSKMTNEELAAANKRYELEKKFNENQKQQDITKVRLESARSIANESSNIANRTRELSDRISNRQNKQRPMKSMDLRHMSDQELRDKINRRNLERQYTQLYGTPQVASGRERVANVLDYAGTVLAIGGSAATIALAIHQMKR